MPRFSAIVPLHNKRRTIERTLRSIAGQTRAIDEIVVVDDASTDGSAEAVAALEIENLRLVRRDEPGPGGYPARNLGVEVATSDWVLFLDADDEWLPDHVASTAAVIASNPDVRTIFFGRSITKAGATRQITVPEPRVYTADELFQIYAETNIFHVNSLAIARDAYLGIGGFHTDRGWRRGGDSELWLRVVDGAGPIFVTPQITTIYDMNFSDVIGNPKNFVTEHPVHRTIAELLAKQPSPETARALKRLANRKTVEWLREMPNSILSKKLALLSRIYPTRLTIDDAARITKSFFRPS